MTAFKRPKPGSLRDHVLIVGAHGSPKIAWARAQRRQVPREEWWQRIPDAEYLHRVAGLVWAREEGFDETFRGPSFRAPHHTVSQRGLTGVVSQGWRLRPGELSLAHGGILLLDEVQEFQIAPLAAALGAALSGQVVLPFDGGQLVRIPAEFRLVASATPCPCGYRGHARETCRCSDAQVTRHMARLEPVARICRRVPDDEWQSEASAFLREVTT